MFCYISTSITGSYCDFLMLCKIYTQDEVEVPVTSWVPKGEEEREVRKEGRGRREEEEKGEEEKGENKGKKKGRRSEQEGKASKQPYL